MRYATGGRNVETLSDSSGGGRGIGWCNRLCSDGCGKFVLSGDRCARIRIRLFEPRQLWLRLLAACLHLLRPGALLLRGGAVLRVLLRADGGLRRLLRAALLPPSL